MPSTKLGILASGRGTNLQAILDAVKAGKLKAQLAVLSSNKEDAQALKRASNHGAPALYLPPAGHETRESYDAAILKVLRDHEVDLVILAGYMRIVTAVLVSAYRHRIMNIHPSLLPSFPGLHAQRQALEYGVKTAGVTVHFVDEQVDHGPIILQATVPVLTGDTEESLSERILEQEHRIYAQAIQWYAEGRLKVEGRQVRVSETGDF